MLVCNRRCLHFEIRCSTTRRVGVPFNIILIFELYNRKCYNVNKALKLIFCQIFQEVNFQIGLCRASDLIIEALVLTENRAKHLLRWC